MCHNFKKWAVIPKSKQAGRLGGDHTWWPGIWLLGNALSSQAERKNCLLLGKSLLLPPAASLGAVAGSPKPGLPSLWERPARTFWNLCWWVPASGLYCCRLHVFAGFPACLLPQAQLHFPNLQGLLCSSQSHTKGLHWPWALSRCSQQPSGENKTEREQRLFCWSDFSSTVPNCLHWPSRTSHR